MGAATGSRYADLPANTPPVADNMLTDEDGSESSCEDDLSVEIVSPPRRHITRLVSAKRAADEMEDGGSSPLPLPRPRKVQKGTGKSGIRTVFPGHHRWLVTNLFIGTFPLPMRSPSPKPIKVASISNTADASASSHLDKDYFLLENPWSEKITYF
jgi:hypothetical protein